MVNARKVLNARKSKRQPLKLKHKILRKVREHHRKLRRDARRDPAKAAANNRKKDPGIPNSWPFKIQLLKQQEQIRDANLAAKKEARDSARLARAAQRDAELAAEGARRERAKERRDAKRLALAFEPLGGLLASADALCIVLDARDPSACRAHALEAALAESSRPMVLVLNKADLLPAPAVASWLAELRATGARALALSAAPGDGSADDDVGGAAAAVTALRPLLKVLSALGASSDELKVGIVGFDGVGKRSLLRALERVPDAERRGISILPKAARLLPLAGGAASLNEVLLRRAAAELLPQPEALVAELLDRLAPHKVTLLRRLALADFDDERDFLGRLATSEVACEVLKTSPRASARQFAVALLRELARGCIPWHTLPSGAKSMTPPGEAPPLVLEPGEADEMDLEEAWGADDVEGLGEEDGEEDGEETGESMSDESED